MFVWKDIANRIDLVNVGDFEFLSEYKSVILFEDSILFDSTETDEYHNFKKNELDGSWKVQVLQHFEKLAKNKGFKGDFKHCIITGSTCDFTGAYDVDKVIIVEFGKVINSFKISYKDGVYSFVDTYHFAKFESENVDLSEATKEFAIWHLNGREEQGLLLYSTSNIADKFSKQRQNVHRSYKDGKLPKPFAVVNDAPYWRSYQLWEIKKILG